MIVYNAPIQMFVKHDETDTILNVPLQPINQIPKQITICVSEEFCVPPTLPI